MVADTCAAGYLCLEGRQRSPAPSTDECPVGSYCPRGVTNAFLCPFETMSVETAARQVSDCRGCQPGYVCKWGDRDYYECPKGSYCPVDDERTNYEEYEYKCPKGTYNPWQKKVWPDDCILCTEGYYCDREGMVNITNQLCPPGNYCPEGTSDPNPCPPGTYVDGYGTVDEKACQACPEGFYCPRGTGNPIQCTPGHYCPEETPLQITCPGGFYCNNETNYQQAICPVNMHCARGTAEPVPCDNKHVCEIGTETPEYCQPGRYVIDNSQYNFANECKECPPGTYSFYDTDGCAPCPAGYVCYGETNTGRPTLLVQDRGEICPKGHYCPEGSSEAIRCPPGTYNDAFGAKSEDDCSLCQADTFQDLFGQIGCKPCGQFATSKEGSALCECIGKYRSYSAEDASCRCMSGFDFLDENDFSLGNASDNTDCFPIVFDNCAIQGEDGNGIPRQPDGTCVSDNECESACNGEPGVRSLTVGVCTCSTNRNVDDICNANCRNNQPTMSFKSSTVLTLTQTIDGEEVTTDILLTDVGDVVPHASNECPSGTCQLRSVSIGSNGFQGTYGVPDKIDLAIATEDETQSAGRRRRLAKTAANVHPALREHARRRLEVVEQTNIFNPIYCIKQNDTFLFQIDSPNNYPVYMKNSVLNSNPDFDFGAF